MKPFVSRPSSLRKKPWTSGGEASHRYAAPPQLAIALVEMGHDAVHVTNIGLDGASDESILESARSKGQIVITAGLDYPRVMSHSKETDPGIILLRGGDFDDQEATARLTRVFAKVPEDRIRRSIVVVDRYRIRRRELPLLG